MIFLDFFAGIGGFHTGMELAGHKCIGFCEFDKYAVASYTSMYLITDEQRKYLTTLDKRKRQKEILKDEYRNGIWYSNDIRTVTGSSVPKADCWCFGAPCQSFSIAGKRAGLDGESGLIREIFRILGEIKEENRPEWLIYENVKGMLSSNRGFDYLAIQLAMDELGYDIEWQLFNSKNWGVPQNRERVYTIGHLRAKGAAKIFPITGTNGENSIPVGIIGHRDGYRRNMQIFDPKAITEALDTAAGGGRGHHTIVPVAFTLTAKDKHGVAIGIEMSGHNCSENEKGVANCLNANDQRKIFGANQTRTMVGHLVDGEEVKPIAFSTPNNFSHKAGDGVSTRKKNESQIHPALQTNCGSTQATYAEIEIDINNDEEHPSMYVQLDEDCVVWAVWYEKYQCYIAIRKLLPLETFRLQGFSDELFYRAEFVNSDSQLYKQSGNSVTVNVVYEIAKAIKDVDIKQ